MEIKCNKCKKIYNIDESKLPETGSVYLKCSICQERMKVSRPRKPVDEKRPEPSEAEQGPPVEYFDPDAKTALLYSKDLQAKMELEKKLADMGFETRIIETLADIKHHFRYNIFDLVILYQFGADPDENLQAIMSYINQMPSNIRRSTTVIYIHMMGNRYDLYDAFLRGVDVSASPMDISQFNELIPRVLEQKKHRYKVFYDCLAKVEESIV